MNGLLVVDKPGGMTSHDVVARPAAKITGERSIGHLGTLDPMATGVLPLLMGKYTRLAQYFSSAEKSYCGTIRFGFSNRYIRRRGRGGWTGYASGADAWPGARGGGSIPWRNGADAASVLRKEDWRQAGIQAGPRGEAG